MNIGDIFPTNNYGDIEILEYLSSKDITVKFLNTGTVTKTNSSNISKGYVKDWETPTVFNIGIVGIGKYTPEFHKAYYKAWTRMLQRCYSSKEHKRKPTYIGCIVCESWLRFQNFAEWCETNFVTGFHLDKDIKVKGNKIYSPETCMFVSPSENAVEYNIKSFSLVSPDGIIYSDTNILEFCKTHGLIPSCIYRVLNNERKHHKGWSKKIDYSDIADTYFDPSILLGN